MKTFFGKAYFTQLRVLGLSLSFNVGGKGRGCPYTGDDGGCKQAQPRGRNRANAADGAIRRGGPDGEDPIDLRRVDLDYFEEVED
jgi:hypothetical protein